MKNILLIAVLLLSCNAIYGQKTLKEAQKRALELAIKAKQKEVAASGGTRESVKTSAYEVTDPTRDEIVKRRKKFSKPPKIRKRKELMPHEMESAETTLVSTEIQTSASSSGAIAQEVIEEVQKNNTTKAVSKVKNDIKETTTVSDLKIDKTVTLSTVQKIPSVQKSKINPLQHITSTPFKSLNSKFSRKKFDLPIQIKDVGVTKYITDEKERGTIARVDKIEVPKSKSEIKLKENPSEPKLEIKFQEVKEDYALKMKAIKMDQLPQVSSKRFFRSLNSKTAQPIDVLPINYLDIATTIYVTDKIEDRSIAMVDPIVNEKKTNNSASEKLNATPSERFPTSSSTPEKLNATPSESFPTSSPTSLKAKHSPNESSPTASQHETTMASLESIDNHISSDIPPAPPLSEIAIIRDADDVLENTAEVKTKSVKTKPAKKVKQKRKNKKTKKDKIIEEDELDAIVKNLKNRKKKRSKKKVQRKENKEESVVLEIEPTIEKSNVDEAIIIGATKDMEEVAPPEGITPKFNTDLANREMAIFEKMMQEEGSKKETVVAKEIETVNPNIPVTTQPQEVTVSIIRGESVVTEIKPVEPVPATTATTQVITAPAAPVAAPVTTIISAPVLAGKKRPERAYKFAMNTIDGERIAVEEMKGKVVVLNFWFTTCIECIREMPHLNEIKTQYQHREVEFISVCLDSESEIRSFIQKHPFSWKHIPNAKNIAHEYYTFIYPGHAVIDKDGGLITLLAGNAAPVMHKLKTAIEEGLAEQY